MLVLSRKKNEKIIIGNENGEVYGWISVTEIRGDKVRIGVQFPKEVIVDREEVFDRRFGKVQTLSITTEGTQDEVQIPA